jgi:DNA-binding response OmpR family regulator
MSTPETANVLLCSIEDKIATQLRNMLSAMGDQVTTNPRSLRSADLVFCGPEPASLERVLRAVKQSRRDVPVVVVSPEADVNAWLNALEAGASDYLPAPFQPAELQWVRESQLASRKASVH